MPLVTAVRAISFAVLLRTGGPLYLCALSALAVRCVDPLQSHHVGQSRRRPKEQKQNNRPPAGPETGASSLAGGAPMTSALTNGKAGRPVAPLRRVHRPPVIRAAGVVDGDICILRRRPIISGPRYRPARSGRRAEHEIRLSTKTIGRRRRRRLLLLDVALAIDLSVLLSRRLRFFVDNRIRRESDWLRIWRAGGRRRVVVVVVVVDVDVDVDVDIDVVVIGFSLICCFVCRPLVAVALN